MMDHERTEKELQEVFQEIQQSYRAFIDDAFALQEQTLKFARSLLESSAETQTRNARATLDALAKQSRRQQEALENLARGSANAYLEVLRAPFSHHHKVEEAMATLKETSPEGSSPGSQASAGD